MEYLSRFLISFLLLGSIAHAEPGRRVIEVNDQYDMEFIGNHGSFLKSPFDDANIYDILALKDNQFYQMNESNKNFGFQKGVFWGKYVFFNSRAIPFVRLSTTDFL